MRRFGVSTHLYHEERLQKAHLLQIAANGFETVEVFATRSHFEYHDLAAIDALKAWLAEAKLDLHSVHAPITDVFANGRTQRNFSTASRDKHARDAALREIQLAVNMAKIVPFKFLVVHLGVPAGESGVNDDNNRDAAARSIEEIRSMADEAGVKVALEVLGNSLSTAPGLVDMIERSADGPDIGICMDIGHAHIIGDATEAIETASEYLVTTHIHDNRQRNDDHLVPFQGSINWASAVMAFEKIGYDGVLMYEVKAAESPVKVLERAASARQRLEALMVDTTRAGYL
jgi:sugar phosphate isomerase/epimerase